MKAQEIMEYLREAEVGEMVWDDETNRRVEVTDMAGGRYLFYEGNEVSGQADQEFFAVIFLKRGGYVREQFAGTAKVS